MRLKNIIGYFLLKLKKEKPIAIIMVDGGFCSTLVKYTLGKYIEKSLGIKVKYDITWFDENGMDCDNKYQRNFDLLKVFPNLDFEIASNNEITFYKKHFRYNNKYPYRYNLTIANKPRPIYLDGYYENWQYLDFVEKELRENLDFSLLKLNTTNQNIIEEIDINEASVAVHVRRGDFVNLGLSFLTPLYYLSSMRNIANKISPQKAHFYFFSNDIDWVKENIVCKLSDDFSYSLVLGNDNDAGYIDLYLISKCKHQISSNSSFGFWGGFLNKNPNKIVIIPDKWISETSTNIDSETAHSFPSWIVLPYNGIK